MSTIRKNALIVIITAVLFIIFGVAVKLLILFANYPGHPTAEENIRVEVVKSLLQLIIVIIIGGTVAALFKWAEQSRERLRIRAETRTEYLKRLGGLYRTVKAARRELRVAGLTTKYNNKAISISDSQISPYREQMERINEVQLELEGLKIESSYLPEFVSLKGLSDDLGYMEEYIGKIVTEFEEQYPLLQNKQVIVPDKLKHLDEFSGKIHRYDLDSELLRFKKSFSIPYSNAIKIISNSLT